MPVVANNIGVRTTGRRFYKHRFTQNASSHRIDSAFLSHPRSTGKVLLQASDVEDGIGSGISFASSSSAATR